MAIYFGKSVMVENRSGASGNISDAGVTHAKRDGDSQLLIQSRCYVGNLALFKPEISGQCSFPVVAFKHPVMANDKTNTP
jgi:tripartite-type tricarboxylate transporter receptor subunit TctC